MKKNLLPFFLMIGMGIMVQGCKDDVADEEKQIVSEEANAEKYVNLRALFSDDHKIKEDEARSLAEDASEAIFGSTRSGSRVVGSTSVITSKKNGLRSASILPDTMAYVMNFADSMGYAIIAADDRVPQLILGCTDNGAYEDNVENPGMKILFQNVQRYVESEIIGFEESKDSLLAVTDPAAGMTRAGFFYGDVYFEPSGPLLRTQWSQSAPYNNLVRYNNCSKGTAPTGCVQTSFAQIMAYWQHPKKIDNYEYNWARLVAKKAISKTPETYSQNPPAYLTSTSDITSVSTLMKSLGESFYANYDCKGTSANNLEAYFMMNIKYGYKGDFGSYDFSRLKTFIESKRPVVVDGYCFEDGKQVGHSWIIDGVMKATNTSTRLECYLLHHNWGWGGIDNGWFLQNVTCPDKAFIYDDPNKKGLTYCNFNGIKSMYCVIPK